MNFLQRVQLFYLQWRGLKTRHSREDWDDDASIVLDDELHITLRRMARQYQCSEGELVIDLIQDALEQKEVEAKASLEMMGRWQNLSYREQQVAMLICEGCTNRQVAAQLNISPETVKVYVRQAFGKLGFHNRKELRTSLSEWVSQGMTPDRS
jgi:DNA-binding NarL/FixJ family response regulator